MLRKLYQPILHLPFTAPHSTQSAVNRCSTQRTKKLSTVVRVSSLSEQSPDHKILALSSQVDELESGLYVVSTPLGNLGDITLRAIRVLRSVSCVYAEDTRRTRALFQALGIRNKLISCHGPKEEARVKQILRHLELGEAVGLVSDAGTPVVSDPGGKVVAAAVEHGFRIIPVPGPAAVLTAIVGTGFYSSSFLFLGFLPSKSSARKSKLESVSDVTALLILYVAPTDLLSVLEICVEVLGASRRCCIARELTKLHESFYRGTLLSCLEASRREEVMKGEMTVVIEGVKLSQELIPDHLVCSSLQIRLQKGDSLSEAVRNVCTDLGVRKRYTYSLALELKQNLADHDDNNKQHQSFP